MERETWKNLGLASAAVVALGCGGVWLYGGAPDEIPAVTARKTPAKVVEAEPIRTIKPKPIVVDRGRPRETKPRPPVDTGGRKDTRPKPGDVKRKGTVYAA